MHLHVAGRGFQFELQPRQFAREKVERNQRNDGDHQAAGGGDQGFADAASDRHDRQFRARRP